MKPPRRRSLTLAAPQKNTPCSFHFARAGLVVSLSNPFFLLKGKENFFAGFCSQRARRRGWPLFFARTRRNSPHTPLPPRPRFSRRRNLYFAKQNEPQRFLPLPHPPSARATTRNSLFDLRFYFVLL